VIRERRRSLGITQAELASRSRVSLRFLGQLEAGTGNISVERLEAVAEPLEISLTRLFAQAEAARDHQRPVRVALLGVRGAGKSTVGKLLADQFRVPFVELDALVEARAGLDLSALFELHGESHFRRLQGEAVDELLASSPAFVVATGGSLVTDDDAFGRLRARCTTVWLRANAEDHWSRVIAQGDGRPMRENPRAMDQLRSLLAARAPLYERADVVIETSAVAIDQVVRAVAAGLG